MLKTLVYGWYNLGINNIGDLLFKDAFKALFPNCDFEFTDCLTKENTSSNDIIIFGGGSFLYAPINIKNITLQDVSSKKIFYIGVGTETEIHQNHQFLMQKAQLIATRTIGGISKISKITNSPILEIPDIVYSLLNNIIINKPTSKSILIFPNAEVIPKYNDMHWKYSAFEKFKDEFSQFLDILIETGYKLTFAPMCQNNDMHDLGASMEIINRMKYRKYNTQMLDFPKDLYQISDIVSKHEIIISQRYHGLILSNLCQRQSISIAHHDKLKDGSSSVIVPYYGVYKQLLFNAFNDCKNTELIPIKLNSFEVLQEQFNLLIGE